MFKMISTAFQSSIDNQIVLNKWSKNKQLVVDKEIELP